MQKRKKKQVSIEELKQKKEKLLQQKEKITARMIKVLKDAKFTETEALYLLRVVNSFTMLDLAIGNTKLTESLWDADRFQSQGHLDKEHAEKMANLVLLSVKKELAIIKCERSILNNL